MSDRTYDIIRLISAEGGQCDVYEVALLPERRRFAAKFPKAMLAHQEDSRQRIAREASHYRRLHSPRPHPHIIQMFELIRWGERDGLVLELMKDSFANRLDRGIGDVEKIRAIREAALGLAHLHDHGITHRDMKPSNILQAFDGRSLVSDLGCATIAGASALDLTRLSIGTPDLMAPEQHGPRYYADARSDVYGLGTCIAAAFLGHYPRKLPANDGHGLTIACGPQLEKVAPAFQHLLRRCLHPDPDARYSSMREFLAEWDGLTRRGVLVTPPKPTSLVADLVKGVAVVGLFGFALVAIAAAIGGK